MIGVFFALQIILALLILVVVLLQKSSSIGLGVYNSSNDSVFGAKGPAGFMSKLTLLLGALFLANTIWMVHLYNQDSKQSIINSQVLDEISPQENILRIPETPKVPLLQGKE